MSVLIGAPVVVLDVDAVGVIVQDLGVMGVVIECGGDMRTIHREGFDFLHHEAAMERGISVQFVRIEDSDMFLNCPGTEDGLHPENVVPLAPITMAAIPSGFCLECQTYYVGVEVCDID